MRITRLRLHDLKRHADLDLSPAPGLTVIRGPNEAGKTTIQRALELGLFRRVTSNAQDMTDLRRWGANGADPTIEIDFEDEGGQGRLRKVFAGARGTVELEFEGTTLTDPAAVDQRLVELTGVASEKFFQSTASIRHHELDDLDKDEGALRDRLQQSMSGADRGTWAARRKLDEALRRYRSEGARNPGALRSTRDRIARLETEVATGESALQALERDRQALSVARAARTVLDVQLEEERRLLGVSERAVTIEARLEEMQARYQRFKRAADLRQAISAKDEAHPSRTALPVLKRGVEAIRNMEYTISEIRAELATEPDVSGYAVAVKPPTTTRMALLGVVLLLLGIGVAVAGALAVLPQIAALAAGAVLLLAGVACLFVVRRRRRIASDIRQQNTLRDEELDRRLRGRSDRAHELQETERKRDEILANLDMLDLARAETVLAAEIAHIAEIEQLQAEYRGLLGDESAGQDIPRVRDQLAASADEMRHALAGMGEVGEAPQRNRQRYDAAVRQTQTQRDRAVDEESRVTARVDQNAVDAEEVAARVEALEAARADLAVIERRVRIYQQTLDALDAAEQATMKKAARYLEQKMGEDVARITDGRYRRIQVDEVELSFKVWAPERGDWVDVRSLSQGTLDQFYLAARLALVRQVTQLKNPPLVFDDPFITFDDARARQALGLLKRMAADHQVIYLTCSSRYDTVADLVLQLPGPTGRDPDPDAAAGAGDRLGFGVGAGAGTGGRSGEAGGWRRQGAAAPGQMPLLGEEPPLVVPGGTEAGAGGAEAGDAKSGAAGASTEPRDAGAGTEPGEGGAGTEPRDAGAGTQAVSADIGGPEASSAEASADADSAEASADADSAHVGSAGTGGDPGGSGGI